MLFTGWEVRIVKNCDRGLENAARGQHFQARGITKNDSHLFGVNGHIKMMKPLIEISLGNVGMKILPRKSKNNYLLNYNKWTVCRSVTGERGDGKNIDEVDVHRMTMIIGRAACNR